MSTDELFVLVVSLVASAVFWGRWLGQCIRLSRVRTPGTGAAWLNLSIVLSFAIIFLLLRKFASHDVRDSAIYLFLYMAMGGAALGIGQSLFPLADLIPRDDVLERGNRAAAYAAGGGVFGFALCCAGANMGDGPGWWVVVFCVALAAGTLLLSWVAYGRITGIMDSVTVGRDSASGVRLEEDAAGDLRSGRSRGQQRRRVGFQASSRAGGGVRGHQGRDGGQGVGAD
mgnify:CR=1 FL=1